MALHTKVDSNGSDGQRLAVDPLLAGEVESVAKHRLPDGPMTPEMAYQIFSYLSGELLRAAVTGRVQDPRVGAYVNSVVTFASPYLESPELVEPLGTSGSYRTTEYEVLASFPDQGTYLSREQGLALVRETCPRMNEQVSTLRRRYDEPLQGDEGDPRVARVIYIGDSPTALAEGVHPAGVDHAQATASAANSEPA
jgi:hypothetical protein